MKLDERRKAATRRNRRIVTNYLTECNAQPLATRTAIATRIAQDEGVSVMTVLRVIKNV